MGSLEGLTQNQRASRALFVLALNQVIWPDPAPEPHPSTLASRILQRAGRIGKTILAWRKTWF